MFFRRLVYSQGWCRIFPTRRAPTPNVGGSAYCLATFPPKNWKWKKLNLMWGLHPLYPLGSRLCYWIILGVQVTDGGGSFFLLFFQVTEWKSPDVGFFWNTFALHHWACNKWRLVCTPVLVQATLHPVNTYTAVISIMCQWDVNYMYVGSTL